MLHQTIKSQINEALRARDTIRLDTLRGINSLCMNEIIASNLSVEFLPDDKVLAIVRRGVKQRKDSIEQFEKGGRNDLADKEKLELKILESFLPKMMSREEIRKIAESKINELRRSGQIDQKSVGKITGILMKELAGKAEGTDVKSVVDELVSKIS